MTLFGFPEKIRLNINTVAMRSKLVFAYADG